MLKPGIQVKDLNLSQDIDIKNGDNINKKLIDL